MKKIIDFCKKQYKILIPVMVVFVLLITIFFLYREYKYDNYRNKEEVAVYQYFGGIRNDYTALIVYNLKKTIVGIEAKDKKINYDSIPVYYKDSNKILFPKEMTIAFPLRKGSQYKLYKYSLLELTDENKMITTGTNTDKYNYFFLYDGEGLYFFPDEVTLQIDGKDYKTLSGMSFINLVGGYTLTYYDKVSDTSEFLEVEGKEITIASENIKVNLNDQSFKALSSDVLLMEPTYLNGIK